MPVVNATKIARWHYSGGSTLGICLPVTGMILPRAAITTTVGSPLIGAQLLGIRESVHESGNQAGPPRLQ